MGFFEKGFIYLLVLVANLRLIEATGISNPSCQTLTATVIGGIPSKAFNPCQDVVNYSFYLPANTTLTDLQTLANSKFTTTLKVTTPACQNAFRNFVCAQIYVKCLPNVVIGTTATYSSAIYMNDASFPFPLPIQRPCVDVCKNVLTQCKGIFFVPAANRAAVNCTSRRDWSSGKASAYTQTLPRTFGNATGYTDTCFMPVTTVAVAPSKETYLKAGTDAGGVCTGITQSLFVPPGSSVNSALALIQAPYLVQTLIESALVTQLAALPPFVKNDCYAALKKYLCGQVYLRAETKTIDLILSENGIGGATAATVKAAYSLTGSSYILPSYEDYDVCVDFQTKCQNFFTLAPTLTPNCSAYTAGVKKFPAEKQVVASVTAVLGANSLNVKLYTSPNNFSDPVAASQAPYAPTCPYGYVVPEHPDNDRVQWVTGTGCALACQLIEFTKSEWDQYLKQSIALPIVGAILSGFLMVCFLFKRKDIRDNYLVLLFSALAFVASVTSGVVNNRPFEDRFCYDNAINANQKDTPEHICIVQGAILTYVVLASAAICMFMVIDAFLKLREWHAIYDNFTWVGFQVFFSLGLPLIPVIVAGAKKWYGFSKTQPFCFIMSTPFAPENIAEAMIGIPVLIVTIVSFLFFWGCIATYFAKENAAYSEDLEIKKKEHKHRLYIVYHVLPAIIFNFLMYACWLGFLIAKGVYWKTHSEWQASIRKWTKCIFAAYAASGADSDQAYAVCGPHPGTRPAHGLVTWLIIVLTATSMFVAVTYLSVWGVRQFCPLLPNPDGVEDDDVYQSVKTVDPIAVFDKDEEHGVEMNKKSGDQHEVVAFSEISQGEI